MRKLTPLTMSAMDESFYAKAFSGHRIPARLKAAVIRICNSYGLRSVVDPLHICNIIAFECGTGDGEGVFWEEVGKRYRCDRVGNAWLVVDTSDERVVTRWEANEDWSIRQAMSAAMADALRRDEMWLSSWMEMLRVERGAIGVGREWVFASMKEQR